MQKLERYVAFEVGIQGTEDLSHASGAETIEELITGAKAEFTAAQGVATTAAA